MSASAPPAHDTLASEAETFQRIDQLEAEIERAQAAVDRHRARTPAGGCGSPEHAAAPARIRELEAELSTFSGEGDARRKAQIERLASERPLRLAAEARRLADEIQRARGLATGSPEVLEKVKRTRERKSLLETRHGALDQTARELVSARAAATAHPPVVWVPDPRDRLLTRYQLIKVGVALSCVLPLLGSALFSFGALILGILALRTVLFGGVQASELVGPDSVYGAPWSDARAISFATPTAMSVAMNERTFEFDDRMPAFREVVRFALAAAARHGIPVTGEPPEGFRALPPSGRVKRPTR
ncbi:MAG: hypothetical protein AB7O24_09645 [Kofleriaceae bacterium]